MVLRASVRNTAVDVTDASLNMQEGDHAAV